MAKGRQTRRFAIQLRLLSSALVVTVGLTGGGLSLAAPPRCGIPLGGDTPRASDALFALRSAVGLESCLLAACDVDASCSITAGDALAILFAAVGRSTAFTCGDQCTDPLRCGDGQTDPGEQCDDAERNGYAECLPNCQLAICGDAVLTTRCAGDGAGFQSACVVEERSAIDQFDDTQAAVALKADSSTAVAAWLRRGVDGRDVLQIGRSVDGGRTWVAVIGARADYPGVASFDDDNPSVAWVGDDTWLLAWDSTDDLGGSLGADRDILFSRSADDGLTWSAPRPANSNASLHFDGSDVEPNLVADDAGRVVVAWHSDDRFFGGSGSDTDVFAALSNDAGLSFAPLAAVNVDRISDRGADELPSLAAAANGHFAAVWASTEDRQGAGSDWDIFCATSVDGVVWSAPILLSLEASGGEDIQPQVVSLPTGGWFVVWRRAESVGDTDSDIVSLELSDQCVPTGDRLLVNHYADLDTAFDTQPRVAVDERGFVIAAWHSAYPGDVGELGSDLDILTARLDVAQATAWTAAAPLSTQMMGSGRRDRAVALASNTTGRWLALWESEELEAAGRSLGRDFDILVSRVVCEECDGTAGSMDCDEQCLVVASCGNGKREPLRGEQCDDGNRMDDDACRNDCTNAWFADVTAEVGLSLTTESWGASWGDFDGDGWLDLWLSNHRLPAKLYRNLFGQRFLEQDLRSVLGDPFADMHGGAWADYDNDGDQDYFATVGAGNGVLSLANEFYRNDSGVLREVAVELGVDYPLGRGRMPFWFDADEDGDLDVLFLGQAREDGLGPPTLFLNEVSGFRDVGLNTDAPLKGSLAASLSDLDGDGGKELILHAFSYPGPILRSDSAGVRDVSARFEIPVTSFVEDLAVADFDGDLRPDFYLAQHWVTSEIVSLDSRTLGVGVVFAQGSLEKGVEVVTSGTLEVDLPEAFYWPPELIFIGSSGRHPSGLNFIVDQFDVGDHGIFEHEAGKALGIFIGFDPDSGQYRLLVSSPFAANVGQGMGGPLLAELRSSRAITSAQGVGFELNLPAHRLVANTGTAFSATTVAEGSSVTEGCRSVAAGDFDNDRDQDVYAVCSGSYQNRSNLLLQNDGSGGFAPVSAAGGAGGTKLGRGDAVSVADFDRDGFLDLVVTNGQGTTSGGDGPVQVFRGIPNGNHWLELELIGVESNADAIGATVVLTSASGSQLREIGVADHSRVGAPRVLHFGLGADREATQVEIRWPHGRIQRLGKVVADQVVSITEPTGED